MSAGPLFIQESDQTFAQALEQAGQFALRTGRGGPAQFVRDDIGGPNEADPGGIAFHFKRSLGHFKPKQTSNNRFRTVQYPKGIAPWTGLPGVRRAITLDAHA